MSMTDEYDAQAEMRAIHKQVGGWFDAFVGSPQYERLTEVQKDKAPGIVRFFAEYSFRYMGTAPERWNRDVLTECCVEILPRKVSAELAFFQAVAPVLSAFFDFLTVKNQLSKARELSTAVAELGGEIVAASQDERNWGPAKALIMAAEKAGVDTCDQKALSLFMVEHNLRQTRPDTGPAGSFRSPAALPGCAGKTCLPVSAQARAQRPLPVRQWKEIQEVLWLLIQLPGQNSSPGSHE